MSIPDPPRPGSLAAAAALVTLAACGNPPPPPANPAPADATIDAAAPAPGRRAIFVEGADGVTLAVEVWLPEAVTSRRLHTVLRLTRYWRATDFRDPAAAQADIDEQLAGFYLSQGLAYVAVDARGTGASFGTNLGPWSTGEQADAVRVLDWIAAQPWSTGRVGALGVSYDGNSAVMLAAARHPALAAVITRFHDHDPYAHLAFPGGLYNVGFVRAWAAYTHALDAVDLCALAELNGLSCEEYRARVAGPRPVEAERLEAAIAEHAGNLDLGAAMAGIVFRDDALGAAASLEAVSPYRAAAAIGAAAVPTLVTAGWLDSGTAAGALDGFTDLAGPRTVVIGAFSHGGAADSDPLRAPRPSADPPVEAQYIEALRFLIEQCEGAPMPERTIRYATLGDDTWRTTAAWPPPTVAPRTLRFGAGGALRDGAEASGQDGYAVDLTASTGAKNRWLTPLDGAAVDYGDRAAADSRLLTYTSAPMATDTRVTGTPVVRLRMSADAADAAVLVYLEDVAPDGGSRYVTEGELRLVHRAGGPPGPGAERVTGRTYRRDAATPYVPGSIIDVVIPLLPTSAKLAAGHRIRVAIGGADADTFAPVTPVGTRFTIHRGAGASTIELPIDSAP